jgi:putative membrane protein insertion efficiency factor
MTLLIADGTRPPSRQVVNRLLIAAVDVYRATASRIIGAAGFTCRLKPSCSVYARAVLEDFGFWRGSLMTVGRLVRCGPWTPMGTPDPPPRPVEARGGDAAGLTQGATRAAF